MQSKYDPETDALYVRFTEAPVVESEEIRPGIILDFDGEGRVVAIEVLDARQTLAPGADFQHLTAA